MTINTDADKRLAEYLLIMFRGLKLSRDLDLAESAIRAERELTEKLEKFNGADKRRAPKRELAHA